MAVEHNRAKQLGQFLQTRRARLTPEQAGLEPGGRRRTPGLRRSEVAYLAGVSVDWYTWLEQGREINVSAQVLESVSRALRLDDNERRHLYILATGYEPTAGREPQREVSPLLQSLLDRQGECPAFVSNSRWDIVGWNRAACAVLGDYGLMSDRERNSLWRLFTSDDTRAMFRDGWEKSARRRLAQFRANYGRFVGDPWWSGMIEELKAASPEFREWWPQHEVLDAPEGYKTIYHPEVGALNFDHLSFSVIDSTDLQLTVNLPLDQATADKLKKLLKSY